MPGFAKEFSLIYLLWYPLTLFKVLRYFAQASARWGQREHEVCPFPLGTKQNCPEHPSTLVMGRHSHTQSIVSSLPTLCQADVQGCSVCKNGLAFKDRSQRHLSLSSLF